MKKIFNKIKNWYQNLTDKKKYFEIISAFLTIPMLITVIIVNTNNIKNQKKIQNATATTATPIQVIITGSQTKENQPTSSQPIIPTSTPKLTTTPTPTSTPTPTPTVSTSCIQEIGPIEIISPQEGEIITADQVCLNVSTNPKYCPLVWSYNLDNSNWSKFNNNDICLYNLTNGPKQLQIQFKNTFTNKTVTLVRNFNYQKTSSVTPTTTPINSPTPTP